MVHRRCYGKEYNAAAMECSICPDAEKCKKLSIAKDDSRQYCNQVRDAILDILKGKDKCNYQELKDKVEEKLGAQEDEVTSIYYHLQQLRENGSVCMFRLSRQAYYMLVEGKSD